MRINTQMVGSARHTTVKNALQATVLVLVTTALALAVTFVAASRLDHPSPKMLVLILLASITLAGQSLAAARLGNALSSGVAAAAWPILLGAIAGLAALPFAGGDLLIAARLAIGTATLVAMLDAMTLLTARLFGDLASASTVILVATLVAALAPVWLAPWIVAAAAEGTGVDTLVAISPLSFLATLADFDYLRSQWFYVHTPLGGLRYSYPTWLTYCLVFLALAVSLRVALRQVTALRIPPQPASSFTSRITQDRDLPS